MQTRLKALLAHLVLFFIGASCPVAALAQYGNEATLIMAGPVIPTRLIIPAVKVADKFYGVSLEYRAPLWILTSAAELPAIDDGYATGSYGNNILDLECVHYANNGNYYSARLVSAAPNNYSFTLQSYTKLASCPLLPDVAPARGQWVRTANSPLSARDGASLAWTGEEIIVSGGTSFVCSPYPNADCIAPPSSSLLRDGAAYNPLTDSWRKIADAPAMLLGNLVTVGRDLFGFAQTSHTAPVRLLRYRSAQDRWDAYDLPSNASGRSIAAFGNKVVVYSSDDETGATLNWLLDSVTGQWTQLPDAPFGPAWSRRYLAFGADLYLFDHAPFAAFGGADGPSYLRAARLRGQQWTLFPIADSVGSAPTLIAGRRLIAPSLGCNEDRAPNGRCIPFGAVFDTATDTWQELPNAPGRGLKFFNSSGGLSESGLSLGSTGYPALDATTDEWFIFPRLDASEDIRHNTAAAGPYGFAFGGVRAPSEALGDSWIWKP